MADFQISGLKELQKALQELPARIERNVMAGAVAAGTRVVLAETKAKAPDQKIKTRLTSKQKKGRPGEIIREIYIKEKEPFDTFYAKFFEFGTASYYTGKGRTVGGPYQIPKKRGYFVVNGKIIKGAIQHPGVKPQPFLRPALDLKAEEAVRTMAAYIKLRLPMETGEAAKGRISRRMIQEALSES